MNSKIVNILTDSLYNKINTKYPHQKIISKLFLFNLLTKVNLDKSKVKQIYDTLIEKIKNEQENLIKISSNNNDISNENLIMNLLPYSKNINDVNKINNVPNDNQKDCLNDNENLKYINEINIDQNTNKKEKNENNVFNSNLFLENNSNKNNNFDSNQSYKKEKLDNMKKDYFRLEIYDNVRNIEKYTDSNNFTIFFNKNLEKKDGNIQIDLNNVISLELSEIILVDECISRDIPIMYLGIEQIASKNISNNNIVSDSFCLLSSFKLINNFRYYSLNKKVDFEIPKSIDKLSFKIFDNNGELIKFENSEKYNYKFILIFKLELLGPRFTNILSNI